MIYPCNIVLTIVIIPLNIEITTKILFIYDEPLAEVTASFTGEIEEFRLYLAIFCNSFNIYIFIHSYTQ